MHQEQPMTSFLFRYESTSGLWVQTKLASPASRPLLEAMNAILSKDGILAFIGTKSEFGLYEIELKSRREANSTGFWTSLPEATILATLGLSVNPSTAEGRSLVLHGSPRSLMLSVLIDYVDRGLASSILSTVERCIERGTNLEIGKITGFLEYVLPVDDRMIIAPNELQDSIADLTEWQLTTNRRKIKMAEHS
jgi:hypothetical protein